MRARGLIGVLHLDHGVGALGQHRSGHDPLRGPRSQGDGRRTGRDIVSHRKHHRSLGRGAARLRGAHCIAVHRRVRPRRHRNRGGHVLSQDPSMRLVQCRVRALQGREGLKHLGDVFLQRNQLRHNGPFPTSRPRARQSCRWVPVRRRADVVALSCPFGGSHPPGYARGR